MQRLQEIYWKSQKLHDQHVELNKYDGWADDDIMTRLLYDNEQRTYAEKERQQMIDNLPRKTIENLGLVI